MLEDKSYFDNYKYSYDSQDSLGDYNLDIRENENFQNCYGNLFSHNEYMTNDEFLENFMKIDYNHEFSVNKKVPCTEK